LLLLTFGAKWDWRAFDFNRDVATVDALLAADVNATDPDLQAFKAHGHKLIVHHGWADVIVPSLESINYYTSVENAQAGQAASHHRSAADETQAFYRLFMVPGMAHCGGGPGLNGIDPVEALEQWVEKGTAPEKIIAKRTVKGVTEITRPVCPYPQAARYNGSGDSNDAANFTCVNPAPGNSK
jgi:feruloyl esterase